jgi:hypothetical protein
MVGELMDLTVIRYCVLFSYVLENMKKILLQPPPSPFKDNLFGTKTLEFRIHDSLGIKFGFTKD